MKDFAKTILYSLLVLAIAAIPALLVAQPHGRGPGGFHGGGFMLERIADRLELTEEQREDIRAVLDKHREEVEPLRSVEWEAREALQEQIHSELYDEVSVREAAQAVASIEVELAVLRARVTHEVRGYMTPEQIAEAEAMRERFREFAETRGGRGRRGGRDKGLSLEKTD